MVKLRETQPWRTHCPNPGNGLIPLVPVKPVLKGKGRDFAENALILGRIEAQRENGAPEKAHKMERCRQSAPEPLFQFFADELCRRRTQPGGACSHGNRTPLENGRQDKRPQLRVGGHIAPELSHTRIRRDPAIQPGVTGCCKDELRVHQAVSMVVRSRMYDSSRITLFPNPGSAIMRYEVNRRPAGQEPPDLPLPHCAASHNEADTPFKREEYRIVSGGLGHRVPLRNHPSQRLMAVCNTLNREKMPYRCTPKQFNTNDLLKQDAERT